MILKIKKINVFSLGKILLFLFFVFSLIEGVIRTVMLYVYPSSVEVVSGLETGNGQLLLAFLVVGPLTGAVVGFLIGILAAFLYNIFSDWLDGVRLRVEEDKTEHKK